ncbi:MAG: FkbM family methyltransferase [Acidiferrobacterales bacterium]
MFNILDILSDPPMIKIIDVGAMSLENIDETYAKLLKRGLATVVGFEPVAAECDKLNAASDGTHTYLPYCIGDGNPGVFHECNYSMTSSLYEPNTALLEKFQALEEYTRVVGKKQVKTHRLDDISEVAGADYIKVDVQGGEVGVFTGATGLLKGILAIETEVEFVPMYKNQPLFAEVDQLLRKNGFAFHRFRDIWGRTFKPIFIEENTGGTLGQALWANVVYVKDFMALDALLPSQLLKLVIILHEVYDSYDLCVVVLQQHDTVAGTKLADAYLEHLDSAQDSLAQKPENG